eukprot:11379393-Alexandrium_andersonii.AAC.1
MCIRDRSFNEPSSSCSTLARRAVSMPVVCLMGRTDGGKVARNKLGFIGTGSQWDVLMADTVD